MQKKVHKFVYVLFFLYLCSRFYGLQKNNNQYEEV